MMSSSLHDSAFQEDLSEIDEKRRVLEQIVEITETIEHMQDGLEAVLILGVSSAQMPEGTLNLYTALSDNLRSLPVNKIKEYLDNLEMVIKDQLEKILRYSGVDFSSDEAVGILYRPNGSSEKNPLELLEGFKRTAQTAVSLRILLKKRGVATPGSPLPVPQDVIYQQIEQLNAQEQQQRVKIRSRIMEMKDDIAKMIENRNHPESMRRILLGVQNDLEKDLNHVESGGELCGLSFVADVKEITDIQVPSMDEDKEPQPAEERKEMRLGEAASRWLNSPWDVSWKDIRGSD